MSSCNERDGSNVQYRYQDGAPAAAKRALDWMIFWAREVLSCMVKVVEFRFWFQEGGAFTDGAKLPILLVGFNWGVPGWNDGVMSFQFHFLPLNLRIP